MIEAKRIGKSFGERKIVDDFSIRVTRGDRLGIVGPNGAGKTTLINILTGADAPDTGSVRLGANLEMATLDQHRESLDPKTTLSDALTGGRGDSIMVGGNTRACRRLYEGLPVFSGADPHTFEVLSGGERGRLMLARALAKPSNLLVLDEPTNDLDLETLDVLGRDARRLRWHGHSHQPRPRFSRSRGDIRHCSEGNGKWIEYAGGCSDMLAQRGSDLQEKYRQSRSLQMKRNPQRQVALSPAPAAEAPAQLQRKARARDVAKNDVEASGRDRKAAKAAGRSSTLCERPQGV